MFVESKGSSSELASMNQQHQCLFVQLDQNLASQLKGPFIWNPIFRWNTSYEKFFSKNSTKTFTKTAMWHILQTIHWKEGESLADLSGCWMIKIALERQRDMDALRHVLWNDLLSALWVFSECSSLINQSINSWGPMKTIYIGINAQKPLVA